MTLTGIWEKRRQSLEDLFFAGRDQQLLEELKKHYALVDRVAALRKVAGIGDRHVLESLVESGIGPDEFPAMTMVPLVQVARSDGQIQATERRALLEAAATHGLESGTIAFDWLEDLMENGPSQQVVDAWKAYTRALCHSSPRDVVAMERADMQDMLTLIAEASGGNMGFGNRVTLIKEAVIHDLLRAYDCGPSREFAIRRPR